jgi:hypothetical protein
MKGKFAYLLVGLLGSVGLATAFALPASASPALVHAPASVKPHATTPACGAVFTCNEPVVAQAIPGSDDLVPDDDFAMTYVGPSSLTGEAYGSLAINFDNDLGDGTQDFSAVQVATVPGIGGGPGAYSFTGFDRHNYGGDPVFEEEYTPNGYDSQLCVTVSSRYRSNGVVLGNCVSAAQQVFIITTTAPGLNTAPSGYDYALVVTHSSTDEEQHLALLAPHPDNNDSLLAVGNPIHVSPGAASLEAWTSIG